MSYWTKSETGRVASMTESPSPVQPNGTDGPTASSPELALARVAVRVQQGGHDVPAETVRRRYGRGLRNFFGLYLPRANTWTLCDNSSTQLVVVARGRQDAEPTILDMERFDRIREQANHGP